MPKIILCQGIQGSGKSTWARNWAQEDPEHRVRWNSDDFRCMLGKYWVTKRESLVSNMQYVFLDQACKLAYDIVIDNMNLNPKTVKTYETFIRTWNKNPQHSDNQYTIEYKLFNTPVEECIRRDSLREHPIGEKVITDTYNRYKALIKELDENYSNN